MARAISIRLEEAVFLGVEAIARRKGIHVNALIDMVLRQEIARDEERDMYSAATMLGKDADSDINYAFAAQSEIVTGDKHAWQSQ